MTENKIYLACLALYNASSLDGKSIVQSGKWVTVEDGDTADSIIDDVKEYLVEVNKLDDDEALEEFAIHDHEGFCDMDINEYTGLDEICEAAEYLNEDDAHYYVALKKYGVADDLADAKEYHENNFMGEWPSESDYAEHAVEEGLMGEIPTNIANYIDYDSLGRDLAMDFIVMDLPCGDKGFWYNC